MRRGLVAAGLCVCVLLLLAGSCGKMLQDAINDALGFPDKVPLTGQNAFMYLQVDKGRATAQDPQALLGALRLAERDWAESKDTFEPGDQVVDLLQEGVRSKQGIKPDKFVTFDVSAQPGARGRTPGATPGRPNLGAIQADYLIPHLEAVPVRNQGMRGTCASFTGIGHIEYAVLKAFPDMDTIDLSEQRFYYMSKPECQSDGCSTDMQGSWYTTGMQTSMASSDFDIPLETDCPYDGNVGMNDLQVPQDPSCGKGAVRVVQIKEVFSPDEIIAALENDGLPVPYASALSDNWYENEGLITLAGSNYTNADMHAQGHAYLIVGYRKLPDMPEEGGMCFVVKNSWGPGWGLDGYSCQTLAWMEKWGYPDTYQPIVMDIAIRDDLHETIDDQVEPEPIPDIYDEDTYDDETVDWDDYDEGDEQDIPEPEPAPIEPEWAPMGLRGPDDKFYRIDGAEDVASGDFLMRGYIRNTENPTGTLTLEHDGNDLLFDGDKVGKIDGSDVTLCTGSFDVLCSLRLDKKKNKLYVEFVNPEYRSVQESELGDGTWSKIATPLGFTIEYFEAKSLGDQLLSQYMFVRLKDEGGKSSDALRLTMDGLKVNLMGEAIGSISPENPSLCSGDYAKKCRIFVGRNGLVILPRTKHAK